MSVAEHGDNPLLDETSDGWERLVQKLGPAAMLLCIEQRMGPRLREVIAAEDIWQETLLHVWRDRASCAWRGYPALRRYVLAVAENRIRNAADRVGAERRSGAQEVALPDATASQGIGGGDVPPAATSTTPSQAAALREEVAAMRAALAALPDDLREVLRLRLFEELTVPEVAARLVLGESAVKHRFRSAAALYEANLRARLSGSG